MNHGWPIVWAGTWRFEILKVTQRRFLLSVGVLTLDCGLCEKQSVVFILRGLLSLQVLLSVLIFDAV